MFRLRCDECGVVYSGYHECRVRVTPAASSVALPGASIEGVRPAREGRVDRNEYHRNYMRKYMAERRAKAKGGG